MAFFSKKSSNPARRRRHFLFPIVVVLIPITLTACAVQYPQAVTASPSPTMALICQSAHAKLLDVTAIPGGMGHAGVVVRASVTSPSACTMSGYSIVGLELSNHSTAMAGNVRMGYLGGFENANVPLPQISVTSGSQIVSFTIQWSGFSDGNCPAIKALQITLPGSRGLLTARSVHEAPFGLIPGFGIYCENLQVTPVVKGSSGSGG